MRKEGVKTIIWGLVFTGAMFLLWYGLIGNPFDEYRIMQRGVPITAIVNECVQDVAEDERGHGKAFEDCAFTYTVNGQHYYGRANRPNVVETIDILYLPDNPTVYREQTGAATGFFDWLFRKAILGILLLVMFVGGGIEMIKNGIKEFKGKGK